MPASVDIQITIWTPEQLQKLYDLWQMLFPPSQKITKVEKKPVTATAVQTAADGSKVENEVIISTKTVKKNAGYQNSFPFKVFHPELNIHRVSTLVFVSGSGPIEGGPSRARIFTIQARELLLPNKNVVSTNTLVAQPIGSLLDADHHPLPGKSSKNTGPSEPV
jgi:hypothetical protein